MTQVASDCKQIELQSDYNNIKPGFDRLRVTFRKVKIWFGPNISRAGPREVMKFWSTQTCNIELNPFFCSHQKFVSGFPHFK